MSDNQVVIVAAARTAIGSLCGGLSNLKAYELSYPLIEHSLKKLSLKPEDVSEVIMGQALTAGQGQNPARQAAVKAGIPYAVPAFTVNKLCGSGMKSVVLGCQSIKCSDAKIVVCGGQESMSQAPHCVNMRLGIKMGNTSLVDTMLTDGLTDAFNNIHMGETAENIARLYGITREEQDEFALHSQQKAEKAQKNGDFQNEIVPVEVKGRKGSVQFSEDEYPRSGTTLDGLSKLRPAFSKDGSITAGNASGVNDGAAVLVISSMEEAKNRKMKPLARIVAYAETGCEPATMGLGPISAVKSVLSKCGWTVDEVDLFEINEAFAAQSIAVMRDLKLDISKVNVNGGAIALGHPIGASGARVLVTLLHGLERLGCKKGVASLCIGGGMGIAMAIERIS